MSKLIVELPEENVRFVFRYSSSGHIRKMLEQNAESTEPIEDPNTSRGGKSPKTGSAPGPLVNGAPHEGADPVTPDAPKSKKAKKKAKKRTR